MLVEVRKKIEKPAFHRLALQTLHRTRIVEFPGLKHILQVMCTRAIKPGGSWGIINPWMIRTSVIGDLVLNDLNARSVSSNNQFAQLRERPEMLFDSVKVLRVVTVKAGARLPFLQFDLIQPVVIVIPRRKPDSGDAEFL